MGFFTWKTADTQEVVWNKYVREHRRVCLLQPAGKPPICGDYDGYGRIETDNGPVDIHEWLAEVNTGDGDRDVGIDINFADDYLENCPYPIKLSFDEHAVYEDLPASVDEHETQGYFGGTEKSLDEQTPTKEEILEQLSENDGFERYVRVFDAGIEFGPARFEAKMTLAGHEKDNIMVDCKLSFVGAEIVPTMIRNAELEEMIIFNIYDGETDKDVIVIYEEEDSTPAYPVLGGTWKHLYDEDPELYGSQYAVFKYALSD